MNKKLISNILRVFIVLMGIVLIFQGILWAFFPAGNLDTYSILVNATDGMNMIRSDIGGPLMIAGAFSVLYGLKGEKWFLPTVLIASGYLVPRIASLFIDGFNQVGIVGVVSEVVFILMVLAHNKLKE